MTDSEAKFRDSNRLQKLPVTSMEQAVLPHIWIFYKNNKQSNTKI